MRAVDADFKHLNITAMTLGLSFIVFLGIENPHPELASRTPIRAVGCWRALREWQIRASTPSPGDPQRRRQGVQRAARLGRPLVIDPAISARRTVVERGIKARHPSAQPVAWSGDALREAGGPLPGAGRPGRHRARAVATSVTGDCSASGNGNALHWFIRRQA
jgi:hypothetical protein